MPASPPLLSLRYVKARLRILKRPKVWGTTTGLLLVLLLLADYWSHPERYRLGRLADSWGEQSLPDASLSAEDRAIGIDIDSLPVLLNDWEFENLEGGDRPTETVAPALPSSPTSATPQIDSSLLPASLDPPMPMAEEATSADADASETASPFSFDRLFTSPPAASPPENRLQTALDRRRTESGSAPQPTDQNAAPPDRPAAPVAADPLLPSPPLLPQPSIRPPAQRPTYLPQTAPPPGTTGYTLPPSLTPVPAPSTPSNAFTELVRPQPVPGVSAPPPAQLNLSGQPQPSSDRALPYAPAPSIPPPPPNAFSVPRAVPGRTLGNGEIDTFSNP